MKEPGDVVEILSEWHIQMAQKKMNIETSTLIWICDIKNIDQSKEATNYKCSMQQTSQSQSWRLGLFYVHVIHAFLGAFINATLLILLVQSNDIHATIYKMIPCMLLWRRKKKIVKRGKSGLMTRICDYNFDIYIYICLVLIWEHSVSSLYLGKGIYRRSQYKLHSCLYTYMDLGVEAPVYNTTLVGYSMPWSPMWVWVWYKILNCQQRNHTKESHMYECAFLIF